MIYSFVNKNILQQYVVQHKPILTLITKKSLAGITLGQCF